MTDLWVLVALASAVPTMAALATYQQGKKIGKTADQIHALTNSNLSRVLADLALANQRIEKLEMLVMEQAEATTRKGRK